MGEQVIRAGCFAELEGDSTELKQYFIRQLASKHSGFEALLLPPLEDPASAELLYMQCQLALRAPKVRLTLSEPLPLSGPHFLTHSLLLPGLSQWPKCPAMHLYVWLLPQLN